MASVFEYFGIKVPSTETRVYELGITNSMYALQQESQKYFKISSGASAADGNKIGVSIIQQYSTGAHESYVANCTKLFQEKSTTLKDIDTKIMTCATFGIVASALSFLPLVGMCILIGWCGASYYMYARATAYAEYTEALNFLVGTCNWSLGNTADPDLIHNSEIRAMMASLYPVLTETQVSHLLHDEIEQLFKAEHQAYEQQLSLSVTTNVSSMFNVRKDDTIALSKKSAEFNRCVYGYDKGHASDFLDAFLSIVPDLYKAASHQIGVFKEWLISPRERDVDNTAQTPHL